MNEILIKNPRQASGYKQVLESIFQLWKIHKERMEKADRTKKAYIILKEKYVDQKKQLTEKSMQIRQIKKDFNLVYDKETGKCVKED